MTRIIAIVLTASAVSLWAVSAKALEYRQLNPHVSPPTPYVQNSFQPQAWPRVHHAPAITKTLNGAMQSYTAAPVPAPAPQYDYDWQRQPAPVAPRLAPPQFSYPQQGYYPREGVVPQAPGYEYDFGGAGTYPPVYPMEGAGWRQRTPTYRATGFSDHKSMKLNPHHGTYANCPR